MITRYRAAMDGVQLDSLDDAIIIHDITEAAPAITTNTLPRPNGDGMIVTSEHRQSLSVNVSFEVHHPDPNARQLILDQVASWCAGKLLTISSRAGKQLHVRCTAYPAPSALKWTDEITVTFTAYGVPFWEDVLVMRFGRESLFPGEDSGSYSASLASTSDLVPWPVRFSGTVWSAADMTVKAAASAADEFIVKLGSCRIHLTGLDMQPGETLRIGHTEEGYMTLMIDGDNPRSVYTALTSDSNDDLIIRPGVPNVETALKLNGQTLADFDFVLSYHPRWR